MEKGLAVRGRRHNRQLQQTRSPSDNQFLAEDVAHGSLTKCDPLFATTMDWDSFLNPGPDDTPLENQN